MAIFDVSCVLSLIVAQGLMKLDNKVNFNQSKISTCNKMQTGSGCPRGYPRSPKGSRKTWLGKTVMREHRKIISWKKVTFKKKKPGKDFK